MAQYFEGMESIDVSNPDFGSELDRALKGKEPFMITDGDNIERSGIVVPVSYLENQTDEDGVSSIDPRGSVLRRKG